MTSGDPPDDDETDPAQADERRSQFYVSLDLDLQRIGVRRQGLANPVSAFLNCIKFPAPAKEIDSQGNVSGHWLLFLSDEVNPAAGLPASSA
jgi:hypothetical protein